MKDILQRKYANYVLKPFLQWYLKKERSSSINGFELRVSTGVFHPAWFFSSAYFSEFISKQDLHNKYFLDIGCGSGILALEAYRKGAHVVALDVNTMAVNDTVRNFEKNLSKKQNEFKVLQSDLFSALEKRTFDVIGINPPYFFKAAQNDMEMAWNCGENGEYFNTLFSQVKNYSHEGTHIYMILAENCEIDRIVQLANKHGIKFELCSEKKIKWERNFIYKLKLTKA